MNGKVDFRHEWKHEINASDMIALRQRLSAVARPDPHAANGRYLIRSLYFDDLADRALREKLDGINRREKFRIRYYNGDTSLIHLEKKNKWNGLGSKETAVLTAAEARVLVLAFGLGTFIFLVYKKTYQGVMYSSSFGVTLLKDDNTDFINALAEMPGVSSAVLVSYNGDYMG